MGGLERSRCKFESLASESEIRSVGRADLAKTARSDASRFTLSSPLTNKTPPVHSFVEGVIFIDSLSSCLDCPPGSAGRAVNKNAAAPHRAAAEAGKPTDIRRCTCVLRSRYAPRRQAVQLRPPGMTIRASGGMNVGGLRVCMASSRLRVPHPNLGVMVHTRRWDRIARAKTQPIRDARCRLGL